MSEALDAYWAGSHEKAIALQRQIVSTKDPRRLPSATDFLLLAMFLNAAGRVADAIAALQHGVGIYPDSAEIHENLGVCFLAKQEFGSGTNELERALALGSASTNILDSLCRACAQSWALEEGMGVRPQIPGS
jgi:tetratricopeptide (TPR) repeat protein